MSPYLTFFLPLVNLFFAYSQPFCVAVRALGPALDRCMSASAGLSACLLITFSIYAAASSPRLQPPLAAPATSRRPRSLTAPTQPALRLRSKVTVVSLPSFLDHPPCSARSASSVSLCLLHSLNPLPYSLPIHACSCADAHCSPRASQNHPASHPTHLRLSHASVWPAYLPARPRPPCPPARNASPARPATPASLPYHLALADYIAFLLAVVPSSPTPHPLPF